MLEWLGELSPEDREAAVVAAFDQVFSEEKGMIVLGVLIDDLYFMDEARDAGQQALNNYAKALLKRCGKNIAIKAVEAWMRVVSKET